jgi:hypothetical protein
VRNYLGVRRVGRVRALPRRGGLLGLGRLRVAGGRSRGLRGGVGGRLRQRHRSVSHFGRHQCTWTRKESSRACVPTEIEEESSVMVGEEVGAEEAVLK